ncbi:hypothetical protein NL676_006117 [Syzygium grande]|nr:hypothetical protein NL676_006117 [Syzygium grande]
MERTRDAVPPSSGEHYGQSQGGKEEDAGGSASRRLTADDAMSFLGEVKDAFQDHPEKYYMFLEIMNDFLTQRIDTRRVMARAKELFTGYNKLIHGFNTFLPEGCKIVPDEPRKRVSFEEVIGFVYKVKECFQREENVYQSFLDALNRYGRGNSRISVVYNEVAILFAGHPDLLEEFKSLLPKSFQDQEELSSITTLTSRGLDMDRTRRDRIADFQAEDEVAVDRPDLGDNEEIMKVHEDEMQHFKGLILLRISAIYIVLAVLVLLLALWINRGN